MQKLTLPVGVDPAAELIGALGGDIGASREIEVLPILPGLVGFHAAPTNPAVEQAAHRERVVADEFRLKPETRLASEQAVAWIELAQAVTF